MNDWTNAPTAIKSSKRTQQMLSSMPYLQFLCAGVGAIEHQHWWHRNLWCRQAFGWCYCSSGGKLQTKSPIVGRTSRLASHVTDGIFIKKIFGSTLWRVVHHLLLHATDTKIVSAKYFLAVYTHCRIWLWEKTVLLEL